MPETANVPEDGATLHAQSGPNCAIYPISNLNPFFRDWTCRSSKPSKTRGVCVCSTKGLWERIFSLPKRWRNHLQKSRSEPCTFTPEKTWWYGGWFTMLCPHCIYCTMNHQNTAGVGAILPWKDLQTQPKPKNAGIDGATPKRRCKSFKKCRHGRIYNKSTKTPQE